MTQPKGKVEADEEGLGLENFLVSSMYGMHTKQGLVVIEFRGEKVQLSCDNARELALNIMNGAMAAERDAHLIHGLRKKGMADHAIAQLLQLIRDEREAADGS